LEAIEKVKPYIKTLDDEIDWTQANQYHSAALQISQKSFEIKKLSIVTITAVLTLLANFTENKIDLSFFISAYLMALLFWFLDSVTYYFQEKLRIKISQHLSSIKSRNKGLVDNSLNTYVIDPERIKQNRFKKAVFNHSLWLYYILIILNTVVLITFKLGWIN